MAVLERSDTARISWEANGPDDGQAVLLIMGLAYPAAMWFRLMPALTERYHVIRVDNRGAGHTGDVPGAPYTVETMASDCLAVPRGQPSPGADPAGIREPADLAQLRDEDGSQDRSDPAELLDNPITGVSAQLGADHLVEPVDLRLECLEHPQLGVHPSPEHLGQRQLPQLCRRPRRTRR